MTLTLEDLLKLLPDFYDKSFGSNIEKIMTVVSDVLQDSADQMLEVQAVMELDNCGGIVLDMWGADYGLSRGNKTDEEYRAFITAKKTLLLGGNDVNTIIDYLKFYIDNFNIVETYISQFGFFLNGERDLDGTYLLEALGVGYYLDGSMLLDGTWILYGLGLRYFRAFSVEKPDITIDEENLLNPILERMKAAGIYAQINML